MNTTQETVFSINDILRTFSSALQTPVVVILIFFILAAVFLIGWLISEGLTERRHLSANIPLLLDNLRNSKKNEIPEIIEKSGLLKRQRNALLELTKHEDFTPVMLEALAVNMLEKEKSRYDRIIKISELVAKLGPIFGLLGTLIPLGPGVVALGQGDTYTLSNSLLIAFDTTVAGLSAASAAMVVTMIRKGWYGTYMTDLDTVAECVLEMEKENC